MNPNRADQIKKMIEEAAQKAYERGYQAAWDEFYRTVSQAAYAPNKAKMVARDAEKSAKKKGSANAETVFAFIRDNPGKAGADVARGLPDIPERTTRTILRRMRINGFIYQKDGGWYARQQ